jgi:hypothetical protein
MRSRIISAAVSVLMGAAEGAGSGLGEFTAWTCPFVAVMKPRKTSKTELLNLLTFNGIFSPPADLNFPSRPSELNEEGSLYDPNYYDHQI